MDTHGYTPINLSSPQNYLKLLNCRFFYNITYVLPVANYFYLTIELNFNQCHYKIHLYTKYGI